MLCRALMEWLGGTVWRSQAVVSRNLHGLPTAPVDRATPQGTADRALGRDGADLIPGAICVPALGLPRRSRAMLVHKWVKIEGLSGCHHCGIL